MITRGMAVGGRFRGASGTPPPTGCPETGDSGRSRRGGGTPPYVWGDMETLWGLRGQSFPGRRAVGAGHARPGGLRGHPSMVRPVGRGLDPSAGGCPGMAVGGRSRRGGAPRPTYGGYGNAVGLTRTPVPGPPRVGGRACPARGLRRQASMVRSVGRGLDPSAGVGGSASLRG